MKMRVVVGWAGLIGGVASGLATSPTKAQQMPGRAEEQRRIVAMVQRSEEDFSLHRRKMKLELEMIQAQFDLKKAELDRANAEFRLGNLGPELAILTQLDRPIPMRFPAGISLSDLSKQVRENTKGAGLPDGLPIYFDPVGLQEADKTMDSRVSMDLEGVPLRTTLRLLLRQLSLTYHVKDGLVTITSKGSEDQPLANSSGT